MLGAGLKSHHSGGPSFGVIGWNDKISSFLTYSAGHPRWSRDVGFTPVSWDLTVGVSVPYVGAGANDQFSSVKRL